MTTTTPSPKLDPGSLYWVDLDPVMGSEQAGRRPVVILSSSQLHRISRRILICPITSNLAPWPTKLQLPAGCVVEGAILLDQARMIDREARAMRYIGQLPDEIVALAREALALLISGE